MDEVKALKTSVGTSIPDTIPPTFKIFVPRLMKNKEAIKAVTSTTEAYGDHPRQQLDIYKGNSSESSPILVFLHPGGLIKGDKTMPNAPDGIVYHNLGAYFASKGLLTIIPNYRRVNSEMGGEDAIFPSGGEDVALLMKWLEKFSAEQPRDVYLMGNSAGGIHVSTYLLDPSFLEERKPYLSGKAQITLKGFIGLAVPFHFKSTTPERSGTLKNYYGDLKGINEHCAYGLLEAVGRTGKSRQELAVPNFMALLGEYDPEDEIGAPVTDFVALWKKIWGDDDLKFVHMPGHNHISPPLALMSGETKGEQWAEEVVEWIQSQ